jgi:hypothetical protein
MYGREENCLTVLSEAVAAINVKNAIFYPPTPRTSRKSRGFGENISSIFGAKKYTDRSRRRAERPQLSISWFVPLLTFRLSPINPVLQRTVAQSSVLWQT